MGAAAAQDVNVPGGTESDGSGLWGLLVLALQEAAPAAMPPADRHERQSEPVEGAAPPEDMPPTGLQLHELLEQLRQSCDGLAAGNPAWIDRSESLLAEPAVREAVMRAEALPQVIQRLIQVLPEKTAGVAGEPGTTGAAAAGTEGLTRFAGFHVSETEPPASYLSAKAAGVADELGRSKSAADDGGTAAARTEGLARRVETQRPETRPPVFSNSTGEAGATDEAKLKLLVRQNEALTSNNPSGADSGIPVAEKSLISERGTSQTSAVPVPPHAHGPEQTGPVPTRLPDPSSVISKLAADDHPQQSAAGGDSPGSDHDPPLFKDPPAEAEFTLEQKGATERFEMAAREPRPMTSLEGQPEPSGEAAVAARARQSSAESLRPGVFDQIVHRAVLQVKNDSGEIRIDLKPDFLGQVRMQIVSENQQVTVRILTELPAVRDMIETNLHQLKSELQSQGLQVQRVEVAVTDDPRQHPGRQNWQDKPRKSAQAGGTTLERPSPAEHSAIGYSGQRAGRLAAIDTFV